MRLSDYHHASAWAPMETCPLWFSKPVSPLFIRSPAKVGDIEPDGRTRPEGGHGRELLCEGELVRINVILIAGCPSVPAGVLLDSIACLEYGAGEVGPLVSRTDYEGVVVSGRM